MKAFTRKNLVSLLALAISVGAWGCNKTPSNTESTATPPPSSTPVSSPAGDAGATTPAQSAPLSTPPQDAQAPAPPPAAVPPPAPPPPKVYTVASGTAFAVTISTALSGKHNSVGDPFNGALAQPIRVGQVTVIKSGTPVSGTVVAAKGQGKFKGEGDIAIQATHIGPYAVTTKPYAQTVKGKGKRTGAMVGGGAGGGALIGGLAGGGKGALIGGLVGAGAGTAGAAMTGGKNASIAAESVVSFTLAAPITITMKPKTDAQE